MPGARLRLDVQFEQVAHIALGLTSAALNYFLLEFLDTALALERDFWVEPDFFLFRLFDVKICTFDDIFCDVIELAPNVRRHQRQISSWRIE